MTWRCISNKYARFRRISSTSFPMRLYGNLFDNLRLVPSIASQLNKNSKLKEFRLGDNERRLHLSLNAH